MGSIEIQWGKVADIGDKINQKLAFVFNKTSIRNIRTLIRIIFNHFVKFIKNQACYSLGEVLIGSSTKISLEQKGVAVTSALLVSILHCFAHRRRR